MDVFDLYAKLSLDSSGYDRALNDAAANGSTFATKFAMAAKFVGSSFVNIGKGVAGVVDQAVKSYGEYEQLVGGAQKIFDEMDYSIIAKDAQQAYKTMNLSASEYLSMVNTVGAAFAATMGDQKGYETMQMGLQAIGDFASGTGLKVEELNQKYALITRSTQSYQSIADQFSGILPATSKDFLEQAKAAGYLDKKYTDLTKVPIDEYQQAVTKMLAKGVDALNLTGNTAAETEKTLTGSYAGMTAAWKNMLTSLVSGGEEFDTSLEVLVDSVETYARNLLPVMEGAMHGVAAAVRSLAPLLAKELPKFIEDVLPDFISAVSDVIDGVLKALPELLKTLEGVAPQISGALVDLVPSLIDFILESIPDMISAGITLLTSLVSGLADNIDTIVPQLTRGIIVLVNNLKNIISGGGVGLASAALSLMSGLALALVDAVPEVLTNLTTMVTSLTSSIESVPKGETGILKPAAIAILKNLAQNLAESVPDILTDLTGAMSSLITTFSGQAATDTTDFTNAAISILNKLINGLSGSVPEVAENISTAVLAIVNAIIDTITGFDYQTLMDSAVTLVKAVSDGVVTAAGTIADGLPEIINKIGEWLKTEGNLSGLVDGAAEIISSLAGGLITSVNLITEKLPGIILEILSWFNTEGNLSSLAGGATKIIETLAGGITSTISTLTEKLPELITGIFNWLTDTEHLTEMLTAGTTIFNEIVKDVPAILTSLGDGIGSIIAGIAEKLTSAENLKKVADIALTIFGEIVKDVPKILLGLTEGLTSLVSGIVGKVKGLFQKDENSGEMEGGLKEGLSGAFKKFKGNIGTWWESDGKGTFEEIGKKWKEFFMQFEWGETFLTFVKNIGTKISAKWDEIKSIFTGEGEESLFGKIKSWIDTFDITEVAKSLVEKFTTSGGNLIQGFVDGITTKWEELKSSVLDGIFGIIPDWLKKRFEEHSPSKVFAEIGKNVDLGFVEGIEGYSHLIEDAMNDIAQIPEVNTEMNITPVSSSSGYGASVAAGGFGGWTINVYGAEGMDEMTLARLVADQVRDQVVSIGAAA